MKILTQIPDAFFQTDGWYFEDPFAWYISPHMWTSNVPDTGTVSVGDERNGVLALVASDGTVADNDQANVISTNELWAFAAEKPMGFEILLQYTEANTDDANVWAGFSDDMGTDYLLDDGAGPDVSNSGFAIYKVDGGTVWKCVSSVAAVQTISTSTKTAGGSSYQRLRGVFTPKTSTTGTIAFFVDGVPLIDSTTFEPIIHTVTFSSEVLMNFGFGIKNGAANLETLKVDHVKLFAAT